jgi:hypothetical protein
VPSVRIAYTLLPPALRVVDAHWAMCFQLVTAGRNPIVQRMGSESEFAPPPPGSNGLWWWSRRDVGLKFW